jgi:ACT domain-containing protein
MTANIFIIRRKSDDRRFGIMKAIITVVGKDNVGILANVSSVCAKHNVNIEDVTQSIIQNMFVMIMMVNVDSCDVDFGSFSDDMVALGDKQGTKIHVMHEDIFNAMHRI